MKISCESRKINEIVIRLEPELAEELCKKLGTLRLSDTLLDLCDELDRAIDEGKDIEDSTLALEA